MLFKHSFVALAVSAFLAHAAPIQKRGRGDYNEYQYRAPSHTSYGWTAPPSNPHAPPLTAVCWGKGGPTCTAYIPLPNGMGFKEYASRNMGGWAPTGTPILSSTTIKPNTPIVAVSTLDVGGSDTWVFFVSQRNELRFFKNTLGPAHWILGDDSQPLGGDIQSLTATVWKNTNGQSAFSVWWNDMEGNVFSWRYDDSGKWNFDGQANQVTAHGALQVTSWMGRTRTIDIYGGDGTHFQNTKANDWTPAAKVNAVGNTIAVSGTNLPWARFGSPANLYYLDGHGAFSLSSASQPPDMSPSMAPSFDDPQNIVGSRTMAWQNPGQYIAMFAYKKHGSMLSITSKTWAQSTGWSMENTVIPPTLVTGQ